MKILLTGGAGYVGSACLRWLLGHGHDPIAYDNLSEGNAAAVPDASSRLIVGDIADTDRLAEVLRQHGIEAVMHFAALASVPDSIADPEATTGSTSVGTKSVLDAMRAAGVRKILFSSTAATYGFHAEMPLREDSPQTPETPYGTTKLAAEWLIKDYARAYGLGYTLLRYFNASGADPDGDFGEDRRHESHLIPLIFQVAVGRRPKVMIYGDDYPTRDGTCVRDYVHTADLAQAHQLAVEALEPGMGRAYNLGSGTGATVLEVLRACEEVVGRPIRARDRRPATRRPGRADRQPREDHQGAGLVAAPHRHSRHRPDRLGVAPPPPPGLRPHARNIETLRMKTALIGTGQIAQQHLACLRTLPEVDLAGVCDLSRSHGGIHRRTVWRRRLVHRSSGHAGRGPSGRRPRHDSASIPLQAGDGCPRGRGPCDRRETDHRRPPSISPSCSGRRPNRIESWSKTITICSMHPCNRSSSWLQSGDIGEVVHVEVTICLDILSAGSPFADRNIPHPCLSMPGGAIADFLPHLASLAHHFVGAHRAVRIPLVEANRRIPPALRRIPGVGRRGARDGHARLQLAHAARDVLAPRSRHPDVRLGGPVRHEYRPQSSR